MNRHDLRRIASISGISAASLVAAIAQAEGAPPRELLYPERPNLILPDSALSREERGLLQKLAIIPGMGFVPAFGGGGSSAGPWFPIVSLLPQTSSQQVTFNFSPGSPPSGYTGWGSGTTLNPSDKDATITLTNGNLTASRNIGVAAFRGVRGTTSKAVGSGLFYFEVVINTISNPPEQLSIGIAPATHNLAAGPGSPQGAAIYGSAGFIYADPNTDSAGAGFASGMTVGVAVDFNTQVARFYYNGVAQGAGPIAFL